MKLMANELMLPKPTGEPINCENRLTQPEIKPENFKDIMSRPDFFETCQM